MTSHYIFLKGDSVGEAFITYITPVINSKTAVFTSLNQKILSKLLKYGVFLYFSYEKNYFDRDILLKEFIHFRQKMYERNKIKYQSSVFWKSVCRGNNKIVFTFVQINSVQHHQKSLRINHCNNKQCFHPQCLSVKI